MKEKKYISPEFELIEIKFIQDPLLASFFDDANSDYNYNGGGLYDNGSNPDIGNDEYDADDGLF